MATERAAAADGGALHRDLERSRPQRFEVLRAQVGVESIDVAAGKARAGGVKLSTHVDLTVHATATYEGLLAASAHGSRILAVCAWCSRGELGAERRTLEAASLRNAANRVDLDEHGVKVAVLKECDGLKRVMDWYAQGGLTCAQVVANIFHLLEGCK